MPIHDHWKCDVHRRMLWSSVVLSALVGCNVRAGEELSTPSAAQEIEGKNYRVQLALEGKDTAVKITITPTAPWVLKTSTPLAIGLECTEGCTVGKSELNASDIVDPNADAKTVRTTLRAAPGHHRLDGELSFFLCSDEVCKRQSDDVTYAFDVP